MSDPFAAYKLPIGLAKGVEIPLAGTKAKFTVLLPSMTNESLQLKIVSKVNAAEDGTIDRTALQVARREVFFSDCILEATGLPDGMSQDAFFETYELAAREVFNEASTLALKMDQEVKDALGKLKPMSNGKSSGKEK